MVVSVKLGNYVQINGFLDAYFDPHYKPKNYDKEFDLACGCSSEKNIYRLVVVLRTPKLFGGGNGLYEKEKL